QSADVPTVVFPILQREPLRDVDLSSGIQSGKESNPSPCESTKAAVRLPYANEPKSHRRHQRANRILLDRGVAVLRDRSPFCVRGAPPVVTAFFPPGGGRERARAPLYQIHCRR